MIARNHVLYNYMGQNMMMQPTNPSTTNHTRDNDDQHHHHAGSTLVSYSNNFMKPNLLYGQSSENYTHSTNNSNSNTNNSGTAGIHAAGNWMANLPQQGAAYNHPTTKPNMFGPASWNHHNIHD